MAVGEYPAVLGTGANLSETLAETITSEPMSPTTTTVGSGRTTTPPSEARCGTSYSGITGGGILGGSFGWEVEVHNTGTVNIWAWKVSWDLTGGQSLAGYNTANVTEEGFSFIATPQSNGYVSPGGYAGFEVTFNGPSVTAPQLSCTVTATVVTKPRPTTTTTVPTTTTTSASTTTTGAVSPLLKQATKGLLGYTWVNSVTASASGSSAGHPAADAFDDTFTAVGSNYWNSGNEGSAFNSCTDGSRDAADIQGTWAGLVRFWEVYLQVGAAPPSREVYTICGSSDGGATWSQIGSTSANVPEVPTDLDVSVTSGAYDAIRVYVQSSDSWVTIDQITVN
jgi:hypothetical protein